MLAESLHELDTAPPPGFENDEPDTAPPPGFNNDELDPEIYEKHIQELSSHLSKNPLLTHLPPGLELEPAERVSSKVPITQLDDEGDLPPGLELEPAERVSSIVPITQLDDDGGDSESSEGGNLFARSFSFEDLRLSDKLITGIYEYGFKRASKIQAGALPSICWKENGEPGRNMIGQAQNGTGKTATFAISLLSAIDVKRHCTQAVVLCPTRELSRQNEEVIRKLGKFLPVKTKLIVPQVSFSRNEESHVVIGTPGKMLQLLQKRVINMTNVKVFVVDEADMMFCGENEMNPKIMTIYHSLPKGDLQVLFFSATYPDDVRQIAEILVPRAFSIDIKKTELTVKTIEQRYLLCYNESDKFEKLCAIYSFANFGKSMVFLNRRTRAFQVAKQMEEKGFPVTLVCGTHKEGDDQMDPRQRDKHMDEFRKDVTKVLIGTDVLSRGIDVKEVTLVVNYTLPTNYIDHSIDFETYLHRVGRTGRFGARGIAINLIYDQEKPLLDEICTYFDCSLSEMESDFEKLADDLRALLG